MYENNDYFIPVISKRKKGDRKISNNVQLKRLRDLKNQYP